MSVTVKSIGEQVFTNQFTGKEQIMVTLSGGYDFVARRELNVINFIDKEHIDHYPVGSTIPAELVELPIPRSFVGKADGKVINIASTYVLARPGEPYEIVLQRELRKKEFAAQQKGVVPVQTTTPTTDPVKAAKVARFAELKANANKTAAEKKEYKAIGLEYDLEF